MPQASQEQNQRRALLALAVLVQVGLIHKVPW
jgi:hypothetical protein